MCPQETEVDKQVAFFFSLGCPVVIITLGHRGSYLRTKDMACAFPAAAFPSVDSTGGADAFIALASYLTEGCPLKKQFLLPVMLLDSAFPEPGLFLPL